MRQAPLNERPTCRHCGDVIGSYEPMIVVSDDQVYATSILAARGDETLPCHHYHEACYTQLPKPGAEE